MVDAVAFKFLRSKLKLAEPGKHQFLVVPTYQSVRNYRPYIAMPKWAYSAKQMAALAERFKSCYLDIEEYRESL